MMITIIPGDGKRHSTVGCCKVDITDVLTIFLQAGETDSQAEQLFKKDVETYDHYMIPIIIDS